jgi:two-component system, sensor histidine kinase and response regulator
MARKSNHILVADDDPIYRGIAQETLESAGHTVAIACDGGEAIALLAKDTFDAAIVDLTMPVADGLTVIKALRSGALNATIPVIVITGHDDAQAVERAYDAGATSFLTKPLNWILFTPHIEFVLRSGQTEKELREASATAAFLSDLKSQVMSALAQEFQTPIKTIFGFSELFQKEVYGPLSPPAYKDMMADISRSANSLNAALLKVMDFGHTLTQNLEVKSDVIKARDAVLDAISAMEPLAQRRDIKIIATCTIPNDAMLYADRALLNQALRGVIENAIRISERSAEIDVGAHIASDDSLVVTVGDQGPAHQPDFLREVNGGSRAVQTFGSHQQSNGVSIKIAKVLAEAHRGQLKISSDTMRGNESRLTIPRHGQPSSKIAATASEPRPEAPRPQAATDAMARLARISAELSEDPRLKDKQALNSSPLRTNSTGGNRSGGVL